MCEDIVLVNVYFQRKTVECLGGAML